MTADLPEPIAAVHAAGMAAVEPGTRLGPFDQSIWFAYRRPNGPAFGLALVEGPVRVPDIGETITLWTERVPLRVVGIESHYGLLQAVHPDGVRRPHVKITVYVDALE
ncbi:hypothetical protein AQJ11_03115 [Streptomyces corchorusii]|uniref:Uncharacterized protein n=2 Tax=Streptomyces TaxID=1883 RepID=A0A117QJZ0_STRCK|nr:hypothetical protein [Streptomyces corchorusii]KUN32531.1 hypothetical protein AQJ11_03115 [Streptomyces corchorusii]